MTHALPTVSLLLSVVLPALVAEALSVALRRLAPGLLRCSLGARRRAVEVPSVACTTEEEFPVASRADTTQQLLHEATGARRQIGQRLAARGIHDVGSDAFDVVPCGAELELCVAPLWGAYATTTRSPPRPRNCRIERRRGPLSSGLPPWRVNVEARPQLSLFVESMPWRVSTTATPPEPGTAPPHRTRVIPRTRRSGTRAFERSLPLNFPPARFSLLNRCPPR